jgi:hypothetical protein
MTVAVERTVLSDSVEDSRTSRRHDDDDVDCAHDDADEGDLGALGDDADHVGDTAMAETADVAESRVPRWSSTSSLESMAESVMASSSLMLSGMHWSSVVSESVLSE